ncbi:MAG: hypothetical protein MK066_06955 [Crocinitomicaceae bacterium]|nr:hypothetical protein [Crocinitomicaceae bacterium]
MKQLILFLVLLLSIPSLGQTNKSQLIVGELPDKIDSKRTLYVIALGMLTEVPTRTVRKYYNGKHQVYNKSEIESNPNLLAKDSSAYVLMVKGINKNDKGQVTQFRFYLKDYLTGEVHSCIVDKPILNKAYKVLYLRLNQLMNE